MSEASSNRRGGCLVRARDEVARRDIRLARPRDDVAREGLARHGDEVVRREFHQRAAVLGTAILSSPAVACERASSHGSSSESSPQELMNRATDMLDRALELLKDTGPEYGGGFANHGPMVAEALCVLGRDDAVIPWVEKYKARLATAPLATEKIAVHEWKSALGDIARDADWIAFMTRELDEHPWEEVLDTWIARLMPGLSAAAAHGIIRTAHAVRGYAAHPTPVRKRELANGLAYWAARYRELPVSVRKSMMHSNVRDALTRIDMLPREKRPSSGSIDEGLDRLRELPSFASVIDFVGTSADPSPFVSEVTEAFAHVYLANARDTGRRIAFVHAVTGPSALRLIAPHVKPETARAVERYAWQLAAGIYAAFGESGAIESGERASKREATSDPRELIDRCVENGDEHAIKMTEACLREHALNPKSVYLAAALDACAHLSA